MAADTTSFDKERWVAEAGAKPGDNKRSLMRQDLETRLRPGMSRDEIVGLMGAPDSRNDTRFFYRLGTPGVGVDYAAFVIEFGPDGTLTRFFTDRG